MRKRTWMRVTLADNRKFWVAIEYDTIVGTLNQPDHGKGLIGKHADDTLSRLTRLGAKVEGPFNEPK